MSRRAQLGTILALALAVRLATVLQVGRLPVAGYQLEWVEGDMAVAWTAAGRIAAGDLLGRAAGHQYTSWMLPIAPLETWERWWGGPAVYHQAPLYFYGLALLRAAGGDGYWPVALAQVVLGLASVALVYALAARHFGGGAAAVAGIGAALYGPLLLHETLALRDTLAVTCVLACLWALGRAAGGGTGRWLLAGVLLAVAVLARETTLAFVPFVVLWLLQRRQPAALLAVLAGGALGLAPLVARNVAVGVSPWALSTRGIEGFVYGHAAGGSVVGLTPPPATQSILTAADGDLGRAIRLTLATWNGDWRGLAAHELVKLGAVFSGYEAADNASWYYFADRVPTLRWSLGYSLVLGLGLVGLWVGARRADDRPLRWFLVSALLGLMYAPVVGRYRLAPTAVLLVYAGAAVAAIARAGRSRTWRRATAATAAALALMAVSGAVIPPAGSRHRAAEFRLAAEWVYRHGDRAAAAAELERGLATAGPLAGQRELPADYHGLVAPLTALHLEGGAPIAAAATLERLVTAYPRDARLAELLGLVYRDALGERERGEGYLATARRLRAEAATTGPPPS